jgi:hypothetical protein
MYSFDLTTTVDGAVVYATASMRNRRHTPGMDYTERVEVAQGSGGDVTSVAVEDKTVASASTAAVDGSFNRTVDWAVIGLEIRPAFSSQDPIPESTSFKPSSGPVDREVTITGSNFTGATVGDFNGTPDPFFAVDSDTQIRANVPSGASSGPIRVINSDGSGMSANDFTVIVAPTITSFIPTEGPEGNVVTISGSNFTGTTAVDFDGTSAAFTVDSDSQIQATVPVGATSGPINVTNPADTVMSVPDFVVNDFQSISSFTPTSGPVGTEVTITGRNFTGATEVKFNLTSAAVFFIDSDTQIRADVPAGASSGAISVTTAAGKGVSAKAFAVTAPPPVISSFAPTSGPVGTEVTLTGSWFTGVTEVTFDVSVAISFTVDSDTQIRAEVPVGASTGLIRVTNASGIGTSTSAFTVTVPSAAVTFEELQSGGSSGLSTVSTVGSLSGGSGDLYLAAISTRLNVAVDSVSGLGLSWSRVDAQCTGRNVNNLEVWMAQGSGAGLVTASFAGLPRNAVIVVSRYSGVDTATPIGNPVSGNTNGVEGLCSGGTDSAVYSFDLTTTVDGAVVYGAASMRNKLHIPGVDYTERSKVAQGSGGDVTSVAVEDKTVASASTAAVDGSFNRTVDWAVIIFEIIPGGGGGANI